MHAVQIRRYGGIEVLSYDEVPDPKPEEGEVLVRIDAAALNHLDIDLREGTARIPLEFPHILGCEGAGRIEQSSSESSQQWRTGDRVLVLEELPCGSCPSCQQGFQNRCENGSWVGVSRQGTYAELIAVPLSGLVRLPDGRPASDWAGVQGAFGTAWHVLMTRGHLQAGEWILINAVGSGVGSAALQVAMLAGARVIATASTDAKLETARKMGASQTINYTTTELAPAVIDATNGTGVDLVFDHVGGTLLTDSVRSLRPGGRLVTCGAHAGETVPLDVVELFRSETTLIGSRTCTRRELATVVDLVATGRLNPVVDSVFPLSETKRAHQRMENREHFGKIVLSTT